MITTKRYIIRIYVYKNVSNLRCGVELPCDRLQVSHMYFRKLTSNLTQYFCLFSTNCDWIVRIVWNFCCELVVCCVLSQFVKWCQFIFVRKVISWQRPYCVDLKESTFEILNSALERYCSGTSTDDSVAPFTGSRYWRFWL